MNKSVVKKISQVRVPVQKDGSVALDGTVVLTDEKGNSFEVKFTREKKDEGAGVGRVAVLTVSK